MRWLVLVLVAACEPEAGIVHDGDTDVVLVEHVDRVKCGLNPMTIDWEVPPMTTALSVAICWDDDGFAEPTCQDQKMSLGDAEADGFIHRDCPGREIEYYMQFTYTAPR